jgi:hypothetical protein
MSSLTVRQGARVCAITLAGFALSALAEAQMIENSSVYTDSWSDSTYMYAYGSTNGVLSIHRYAVDVTITSPTGRVATCTGDLQSGFVSSQCALDWDYWDTDFYTAETTHRAYCTIAQVAFVLAILAPPGRKPPTQYCLDGTTVSSCADGNRLAPVGRMKAHACKYYDQCCKPGGTSAPGWCRKETCAKCSGQARDSEPSQCQSQDACQGPAATMCAELCP